MQWSKAWFFVARRLRRSLRPVLAKSPGAAVALGLTAAFVVAAALVTQGFGDVVGDMKRQRELHKPDRTGQLAGELFGQLTRGLPDPGHENEKKPKPIDFDARRARLRVNVDCGGWNAGFPAPDDRDAPEPLRSALAQFCQTDVGAALRGEIDAWNAAVATAAVRDDWDGVSNCKDRSKPNGYIPSGCHPNAWSAAVAIGPRESKRNALANGPSPGLFGFLAADQHEGFGDWRRFDASGIRSDEGALVLTRGFDGPSAGGQTRAMTVDVVGDVEEASWRDERDQVVQDLGVGRMYCEAGQSDGECAAALEREGGGVMPRARRLTIDVPLGTHYRLAIRVKPISVTERRVAALSKASFHPVTTDPLPTGQRVNADGQRVETIRFTAHIEAQCTNILPSEEAVFDETAARMEIKPREPTPDEAKAVPSCGLFWDGSEDRGAAPGPVSPMAPGSFGVAATGAAGRVPLSEARPLGEASAEGGGEVWVTANADARRLGLLPVVGFDSHDQSALLGRLRQVSPPGGDVEADLTIDPDLQARANGFVNDLMGDRPNLALIRKHLPDEFKPKRRVAIVLIDAGAATDFGGYDEGAGRILAAATYPQVVKVLSEWDLLALDAQFTPHDPIAARGWTKSDRFNAAGSTFKPIVALAAIDKAARGDEVLTRMLGAEPGQRGLDAAGMASVLGHDYDFGWDATVLNVPKPLPRDPKHTVPLHNDGGDKEPVKAAAVSNGKDPPTVSLVRAMATSNNLWFARLALATDASALTSPGPDRQPIENANPKDDGDLAIARMIDRLWPKEARALFAGFSPQLGYLARLQADPIAISETDPGDRLLRLALSGYGEGGVQVTPLAMASVMASIATGRIVEPRLTEAANPDAKLRGASIFDPAPVAKDSRPLDAVRAENMLATLREALAAVVRQGGGTAYEAFASDKALAARVHGKTGTATVGGKKFDPETNYNTVWFDGWIDGLRNTRFAARRVAFACMVTHADKHDGTAGGSVCAPLMRQLLQDIENPAPVAKLETRR